MIQELKNGNYIKINKVTPVGYNRTYLDFTVIQKDGYWKHNEQTTFLNSMYYSEFDYLGSHYDLK
tara:strand:+ start:441 stop:635 length:195 start_codon:yes stop_codon:yes gene_type:complete